MKKTISTYYFALSVYLIALLTGCKTTPHEFTDDNTGRILKTLSADDMKGRQTFTPDIKKAEEFIASEFTQAGLSHLEGLETYRQEFVVNEAAITKYEVTINGKSLAPEKYFGLMFSQEASFQSDDANVVFVDKGGNFRSAFDQARSSDEDVVVIIHSSFEDMFSRYRNYFSRANRFVAGDKHGNVLFMIADKTPTNFEIDMTAKIEEKPLANVVGMIEGKRSNEFVLFSAHHDHLGVRNIANGDSIANGANDDASGVTAVIELAHYFKSMPKPERSILFATFTAEEMGGYGSKYFSQQLNPDQIVAMFNIEMIGKPAVSGPNTAWITGYDRSTFGELLSKSAEGTIYEFYPDPYPDQNLFYRSDNATLARLGVPAHSISTTPIDVDQDYHQVSDEYETIDISHLTNTIKAIAKAAEGIVSGQDTPTRVDTDLVD